MRKSHLLVFASLLVAALLAAGERLPSKPELIFNLDASEFFVGTFGPVTPDTLDRYVDSLAGTGVTDFFICVNMQRANFRSSVWETDWDGYDPARGDDQPFFAGIPKDRGFERDWYRLSYAWSRTGVDYPRRMLEVAKQKQLRGWLSIRMNDAHYPTYELHPYHSTFWRQHPEWRLENTSLDYGQPEVREHYLKLIREVTERYDMFGLELDFMRHGFYFRPHDVDKGREIMNGFLRKVRALSAAAGARLGHPVEIAVRVPSRPWISSQRGLDAVAWGREKLVDLVVASPWWSSSQMDVPIETWKGLLEGTSVRVAASLEDGIRADDQFTRKTMTPEETRGAFLSFLDRGADTLYLFNWFTNPRNKWPHDVYREFLVDAGSTARMLTQPRRHAVTLIDPWAEGEPSKPEPLQTAGRDLALRIHIGPRPDVNAGITVQLGIAAGDAPQNVQMNNAICKREGKDGELIVYRAPLNVAREGYNLVQIELPAGTVLNWAEIRVVPARSK